MPSWNAAALKPSRAHSAAISRPGAFPLVNFSCIIHTDKSKQPPSVYWNAVPLSTAVAKKRITHYKWSSSTVRTGWA